jgi:hypothetical protein
MGISRAIPIAIKGEAYDIHVDIKFPQDSFAGKLFSVSALSALKIFSALIPMLCFFPDLHQLHQILRR